ncbi:MAG: hypothetical protein M3O70_08790 [Actinomycetota bacterium]|nr:hypothetical protein [Actinomycetota bacterium]
MTESGLRQYDDVDPYEAAVRAWVNPGRAPGAHAAAKRGVRALMPLLARALDRMAAEQPQVPESR